MQSTKNKVIVACAGAGKTTHLVNEALSNRDKRIAIVTYTNSNAAEIAKKFGETNGGIPRHVEIMTWFAFLLREGARPYQAAIYPDRRIESVLFKPSPKKIPEKRPQIFYFAAGELIYADKLARFIVKCEEMTSGRVTRRLRNVFTDVFIDEFQDLAGWDLDLVEKMLRSQLCITLVGDPRQHIYQTNLSNRNKGYRGIKVLRLIDKWERKGLCRQESMTGTHRCNSMICRFANTLWPEAAEMKPLKDRSTGHDGVFLISKGSVQEYMREFRPQVLRHKTGTDAFGYPARNFGEAKGMEFERVLIIPTEPIRKYLKTGELRHIEGGRNKLHVAVTRAFHSVAFVYDGDSVFDWGNDRMVTRWPLSSWSDSLFGTDGSSFRPTGRSASICGWNPAGWRRGV